jgi:hypothetical protein
MPIVEAMGSIEVVGRMENWRDWHAPDLLSKPELSDEFKDVKLVWLLAFSRGSLYKIEASQHALPFKSRSKIRTWRLAVTSPAVAPPPGSFRAPSSIKLATKSELSIRSCKLPEFNTSLVSIESRLLMEFSLCNIPIDNPRSSCSSTIELNLVAPMPTTKQIDT